MEGRRIVPLFAESETERQPLGPLPLRSELLKRDNLNAAPFNQRAPLHTLQPQSSSANQPAPTPKPVHHPSKVHAPLHAPMDTPMLITLPAPHYSVHDSQLMDTEFLFDNDQPGVEATLASMNGKHLIFNYIFATSVN